MPATPLSPKREKALLIVLMLVQFTTIVDFMIMMPLYSYLMSEMRIGTAAFGLLISAYAVAAGVSSLLAASLADRFDRRHLLLLSYVGLTLATLGCALATGHVSLLIARAIAGVFGGVLGSITLAIVGDLIPIERRGRAMGLVMMGFSLAAVAGVPLGLLVAAELGWRAPFVVLSAICVIVGVAALRWVPSVRGHMQAEPLGMLASYRELLAVPNHWRAFLLSALVMFSGFLVIPYIAPSLVANVGMAPQALSWIYLVGGGLTLVSRPWIGRLTDRFAYARVLTWLVIASCVPILLVTASLPLSLGWQLAIAGLFFMMVSGRFIPAMAIVTASTQSRFRGRVMAFNSAVQNFASGGAAFLAGLIMYNAPDGRLMNYQWVGVLACLVGLAAIVVARRVERVA